MRFTAKRSLPAHHFLAVGRSFDVYHLISKRIFSAGAVVLACALSAGCSTVSPETVADATPPASVSSTQVVVETAQSLMTTAASAHGTDQPYSVAGKSYRPTAPRKPGKVGAGLASWYGEGFQGRRTANGETFDMSGFTAAHPTLPLPSYVRVTNVQNGRSMVVRVNDRGPFHKNRLIDVSKRTADMLGFRGAGVGNVKVDYIGPASPNRDDRKLMATYQEFGRPTPPAGMQVASLSPVSDAALAAESGQSGGVIETLVAKATTAATTARDSVVAVAKAIPLPSSSVKVATAAPVRPSAAAKPQPSPETVASLSEPTETAAPHKRVIQPSAPVLASSTPDLSKPAATIAAAPAAPSVNVSSRIASSFEAFGGAPTPFGQNAAPQAGGLAYSGFR